MGWTALLNLRAWLLIALIGVSAFAAFQHTVIGRLQAEAETFDLERSVLESANKASTDTIAKLVIERNGLLLARSVEAEATERAIADSQARTEKVLHALDKARARLSALSLTTDCRVAMEAPICPSIAKELRAP